MPFVTEELWQALRPRQEKQSIMFARIPAKNPALVDEEVEREMAFVQSLIEAVRNIRGEMSIPPSRELTLQIRSSDRHSEASLRRFEGYLARLARVTALVFIGPEVRPKLAASAVVSGEELFVPLEGLIDLEAERNRIGKEVSRVEGLLNGIRAKLENQNFVSRAPQEVVANEREKLVSLRQASRNSVTILPRLRDKTARTLHLIGVAMTRTLCALLLFCSVAAARPAGQSARDGDPLPLDSAIVYGKLENGLTYYIRKNVRPESRAEVRLVINAGSVLENDDQRGLAHFVEHMAFNGTKNFKRQELVDYLQSVGVRFGPDLNAYTSFDETVYMIQVPTDTQAIVEKAFDILEDWAHQVSLEGTEIDKERGVIIEEWRLGRGAGMRMMEKQLPSLLKGSRYAERFVIGTKENLEKFPHETLRQFYRDWYRPELMAVIAVGDFDPVAIRALIDKHFSAIPRTASPRKRELFPVPDHTETLYAPATDPEATNTSVAVLYKMDVLPEVTAADYRRTILEGIYNAMLNARLREIGRQADPPFLYAGSSKFGFVRTKEFYQVSTVVRENGIQRGLAAALTEAIRVKQHGFTATELERMKRDLLRSLERAYAEREKTESASYAGEYARHFLEGEPSPGIAMELELYRRYLPGISVQEVNALAGQWMTAGNRVITVNAPEKAGVLIPTREAVLALIDSVDNVTTTPYVDAVASVPLMAKAPPAASISSTNDFADLGITEWRLSNGVRVVLKPTDFKNDEVLMAAFSPGGTSSPATGTSSPPRPPRPL